MTSFIFWQRWLFYSSLLFAGFAIIFALDIHNPIFNLYDKLIASSFWNTSNVPAEIRSFYAFAHGPLGGTIACCYIFLAYIAFYPFKRKETWARNALIVAFGTWLVLDSAICLYYGIYFQVYIINAFSFLQKALPIIFTWKEFKKAGHA